MSSEALLPALCWCSDYCCVQTTSFTELHGPIYPYTSPQSRRLLHAMGADTPPPNRFGEHEAPLPSLSNEYLRANTPFSCCFSAHASRAMVGCVYVHTFRGIFCALCLTRPAHSFPGDDDSIYTVLARWRGPHVSTPRPLAFAASTSVTLRLQWQFPSLTVKPGKRRRMGLPAFSRSTFSRNHAILASPASL